MRKLFRFMRNTAAVCAVAALVTGGVAGSAQAAPLTLKPSELAVQPEEAPDVATAR